MKQEIVNKIRKEAREKEREFKEMYGCEWSDEANCMIDDCNREFLIGIISGMYEAILVIER